MKPEIVRQMPEKIAHELLNDLVEITNLLYHADQREAFFRLGTLVEEVAERARNQTDDLEILQSANDEIHMWRLRFLKSQPEHFNINAKVYADEVFMTIPVGDIIDPDKFYEATLKGYRG